MKSYTSILEETLEEELFMSNLNTLRIEIDKKYKIKNNLYMMIKNLHYYSD